MGSESPPCVRSTALTRRPPSLARVPVSPVPRGQRYYEAATTSRRASPSLICFASGVRAILRSSCSPWRRSRMVKAHRARHLVSRPPFAGTVSRGRKRDLTGSQAIRPTPLPRSKTPAGPTNPHLDGVVDAAPAQTTAKSSSDDNFEAIHAAWHLLPTLHDGVAARHARLLPAGWLTFTGRELNPLGSR